MISCKVICSDYKTPLLIVALLCPTYSALIYRVPLKTHTSFAQFSISMRTMCSTTIITSLLVTIVTMARGMPLGQQGSPAVFSNLNTLLRKITRSLLHIFNKEKVFHPLYCATIYCICPNSVFSLQTKV